MSDRLGADVDPVVILVEVVLFTGAHSTMANEQQHTRICASITEIRTIDENNQNTVSYDVK